MEIGENESKEFGEFPNSEVSENVNDSLVEDVTKEEKQVDKKPWSRISSQWNRPIFKIYADNFGFTVNGYQPMIDYLDLKESGGQVENVKVHLPYLEERCRPQFSASNPFTIYTNSDIDRFIEKGERIQTQIRQNDAAGENGALNRTHSNWSMVKKFVQQVKKSSVVDPRIRRREIHYDDYYNYLFPSYFDRMSTIVSLGIDPIIASRVAQCKIERENALSSRRSRMDEIDRQYDDTLKNMRNAVECIPQPSFAHRGPYGEVLTQDCFTNADDMVMRNRFRREEDLNALRAHVDRITRYDDLTNRSNLGLMNNDVINTLSYLREKQANTTRLGLGAQLDRIRSERTFNKHYSSAIDNIDDDVFLDYLMKRQLSRPITIEDYRVPLSELRYKAATMSDVQERVYNRAKEINGETSGMRKIKERSKYLNVMDPVSDRTGFNLMVLPTRTETNIDHMARSFASRGRAVRRYNVDEEMDEPYPGFSTEAYRTFCVREPSGPAEKLPSDYERVRCAESRAKERSAILGL